jgi:hypothetical protein
VCDRRGRARSTERRSRRGGRRGVIMEGEVVPISDGR